MLKTLPIWFIILTAIIILYTNVPIPSEQIVSAYVLAHQLKIKGINASTIPKQDGIIILNIERHVNQNELCNIVNKITNYKVEVRTIEENRTIEFYCTH